MLCGVLVLYVERSLPSLALLRFIMIFRPLAPDTSPSLICPSNFHPTDLIPFPQAEKALDLFLARANDPSRRPFHRYLHEHGVMLSRIAQSRINIDSSRLVVLNAAITIDQLTAKGALLEIAAAKILVPQTLLQTLDWAIQAYGAEGVCQDTPLAYMWAHGRTMRIVDGPDEVHLQQVGRYENKRGEGERKRLERQKEKTRELFEKYGVEQRDVLALGRVRSESKAKL